MWMRPGLDQRARCWITLIGVSESSSEIPIRSHVHSAMASGNATRDEMNEFVLQYAIHGGWQRASVLQSAVLQQAERVAKGDRKSVVSGKSVSVRVELGGCRSMKKNKKQHEDTTYNTTKKK